jgi:AcrR family transcriptional regulator
MDVIDIQGLEAFSLELVARRMGVRAPSLYHHFKDKTELLAEVARLMLAEIELPEPSGDGWVEDTVKLCLRARRSVLHHPNAAPLLLQFFPRRLLLPSYDLAVAGYDIPMDWRMVMLEGLDRLTFGTAFFEAAARVRSIDPMPHFDAARLPNLAEAIRANPFDGEQLFAETIRAFIVGVQRISAASAEAEAQRRRSLKV